MNEAPKKFWIVKGSGPSSYQHDTYDDAVVEARRLARLHPGNKFFVMESVAMLEKRDVVLTRMEAPAKPATVDIGGLQYVWVNGQWHVQRSSVGETPF